MGCKSSSTDINIPQAAVIRTEYALYVLQVPEEVIFRHARKLSNQAPGLDDVVEIQHTIPKVRTLIRSLKGHKYGNYVDWDNCNAFHVRVLIVFG